MQKDFTVLIDADDVLWNLLKEWVFQLNYHHDTNVEWDKVDEWDICPFFPRLSKEEVFAPLNTKELWEKVRPIDLAVGSVKTLFDTYNCYICTSSKPYSFYLKYEYAMKRLFPFVPYDRVICAKNKQLVKADVRIDDALHNLCGTDFGILFTAPHNSSIRDDELPPNVVRANNWVEVLKIITDEYSGITRGSMTRNFRV